MAKVTQRMIAAAREFESASIEAGFDYTKNSYMSRDWNDGNPSTLYIFGVDTNNKTHEWKEGEEWPQ